MTSSSLLLEHRPQVAPRDAADEEDADGPSTAAAKKSKRQKQREKEERERMVRERELALADGTDAPASADDFERRLMARLPPSRLLSTPYIPPNSAPNPVAPLCSPRSP